MSHTETDKLTATAIARVLKARVELTLSRRFYAVLVANVTPVPTSKVSTMATNGKQHFFNPAFIAELTQEQLLAVQAHESEHDARHHHTRRGSRDPELWNKATDYVINADLKAEGFKLPSWALYDPRFAGLSAEDAYRILELDQQKRDNPHPQPQPEPEDDDGEGESEPEEGEPEDEPEDETGGDAGDEEGDDEGEPGEGEGEGEPDDEANDGQPGEGEGDEGDTFSDEGTWKGKPGDGQGTAARPDGTGHDGTNRDLSSQDGESADGDESSADLSDVTDPGKMGSVIDAADDVADLAEIDDKWERIVRQAASMAKAVGELPGHVSREVARANNPSKDWRNELRDWVDQGNLRIETWNRPNKRFIGRGMIMPGSQRDGVNKIACIVDTSGSVDHIALAAVQNEMQAMLDDDVISELVVVYADTRVTRTDEFRTGDDIEFDPRGGGGTDMRPAFQWIADNVESPSGIVCFTDLYIGDAGTQPDCPVMWAVHGYPEIVRQLIANAPWGAPGVDVGQH
jgi:predicted metal-dependent peptidase